MLLVSLLVGLSVCLAVLPLGFHRWADAHTGAIAHDAVFVEVVPCGIAHPGLCATQDGYVGLHMEGIFATACLNTVVSVLLYM